LTSQGVVYDDLDVGDASYQWALWSICGGTEGDRVRHQIVAVFVPQPQSARIGRQRHAVDGEALIRAQTRLAPSTAFSPPRP
jgi:hypothetical protein